MTAPVSSGPLVSAIIPAYNSADTIGDAIESIRRQAYPNIEIVICNDGSTDDTAAVIGELCPEASYIEQENAGPAAARNAAAAVASGEFLATLDSDDQWTPGKIERQLAALSDNPRIGAIATNGIAVAGDRRYPWLSRGGPRLRELSVQDLLRGHRNPIAPSMLCRADVFRALGGYDCDIVCGEDLDLFCRIVASGQAFALLNEPLYVYVRGEGAITGGSITRHAWDMLRVVEKMDPRVQHDGYQSPLTPREFSEAYGERLLRLAWAHLRRGEREEAERYLQEISTLPAPGPRLRMLAGLAGRNRRLFRALFTVERRARHLELFVGRWGLIGGVRQYLAGRAD